MALKSNYEYQRAFARRDLGKREHMDVYVLTYRHTDILRLRVIFFYLFILCVSLCACLPLTIYIYSYIACWPHSDKLSIHGAIQHFEKVQSCRPKRIREAVHTEASVSLFSTSQPCSLCSHAPSRGCVKDMSV